MVDNVQRSPRAVTGVQVSWAHLSIAAAVLTPALLASLLFLSPEFDPSYRLMSEYALGRYGWVLSLTFAAWGLSSWTLALAIWPHIRTRGGRTGVIFLVAAGLGEASASVFDIRHDILHNLAGSMGIVGLPVAAMLITASVSRCPEWVPARRHMLVLANLTWISVVLFVVAFVLMTASFIAVSGGLPAQAPPTLPRGVVALVGWANRFLVLVYCTWVVAGAVHLIRLQRDRA